jgi:hypothetical protein
VFSRFLDELLTRLSESGFDVEFVDEVMDLIDRSIFTKFLDQLKKCGDVVEAKSSRSTVDIEWKVVSKRSAHAAKEAGNCEEAWIALVGVFSVGKFPWMTGRVSAYCPLELEKFVGSNGCDTGISARYMNCHILRRVAEDGIQRFYDLVHVCLCVSGKS